MRKKLTGFISVFLIICMLAIDVASVRAEDVQQSAGYSEDEKSISGESADEYMTGENTADENVSGEDAADENKEDTEVSSKDTSMDKEAVEPGDEEDTSQEPAQSYSSLEAGSQEPELRSGEDGVTRTAGILDSGQFGIQWTLYEDGLLLLEGEGGMEWMAANILEPYKEQIRSIVFQEGVTSICANAFAGCINLTNVVIPESMVSIQDYAFSNCSSLTTFKVPQNLTNISTDNAFNGCISVTSMDVDPENTRYASIDGVLFSKNMESLLWYPKGRNETSYTIPDGVKGIEWSAFEDCTGLSQVNLPESLSYIGVRAFAGCTGLKNIRIPDSVGFFYQAAFANCTGLTEFRIPIWASNIDFTTFSGCTALTDLTVDPENQNYIVEDRVLFNKDKTKLLCYLDSNTRESYAVPDTVTTIGWQSIQAKNSLTTITIPSTVTIIDPYAFYACESLKEVIMKGNAPEIHSSTFDACSEDLVIYVPAGASGYDKASWNELKIVYGSPEQSFTVSYDANSGKDAPKAQKKVPGKNLKLSTSKPARTGYTFLGWGKTKTSKTVSYSPGASYKEDKNITLYALWKPNKYKIAFNSNKGSGKMSTVSRTYGKSEALPANRFTRTYYLFKGWNTKADGKGTSYTDKKSVKNLTSTNGKTVTLYAMWAPRTYKITYVLDGGKNNSANPGTYKAASGSGTLKSAAKKGYTFDGWYTKYDTETKKYSGKISSIKKGSTGNKKLYAKYTANTYKVVYNKNTKAKVTGTMKSTSHTFDKSVNLPSNTFKRTGYLFHSWNTKSDGKGDKYTNKDSVKNLTSVKGRTVTLYAIWKPISYKVVYDGNKATGGSMKSETFTYSTSKTLSSNAFVRKGYYFTGWNTKADGKGTKYSNKNSAKEMSTANGKTIKLYAQWASTKVSVKCAVSSFKTGNKYTLKATATNKEKAFLWSSSNKKIATVTSSGVVAFHSPGTATITVMTKDKGASAKLKVTAKGKSYIATSKKVVKNSKVYRGVYVSEWKKQYTGSGSQVDQKEWGLEKKESITHTAKCSMNISFGSLKTALQLTNARESIKTETNFGMVSKNAAYAALYIRDRYELYEFQSQTIYTSSFTKEELAAGSAKKETLRIPLEATADDYKWVYNKNYVPPLVEVKIIGPTAVEKKVPVNRMYLDCTSMTLRADSRSKLDKEYQLSAFVLPQSASNKQVKWSSSNSGIASVNSSGKVTAKAAGTAVITATAADGSGQRAVCQVIVNGNNNPLGDTAGLMRSYEVKEPQYGNRITVYRRKTDPIFIREQGEQTAYRQYMGEETLRTCSVSASVEIPFVQIRDALKSNLQINYDMTRETIDMRYSGRLSNNTLQNTYVSYYAKETYQEYTYKILTHEYDSAGNIVNTRESFHTMLLLDEGATQELGWYANGNLAEHRTTREGI